MAKLICLPCLDSQERGAHCHEVLRRQVTSALAVRLGRSAVLASESGVYLDTEGREAQWKTAVDLACARKISLPPEAVLSSRLILNPGGRNMEILSQSPQEPSCVLQGTTIRGRFEGLLGEVRIEQTFANQEDKNIEAVFTFPVPAGAVLLGV